MIRPILKENNALYPATYFIFAFSSVNNVMVGSTKILFFYKTMSSAFFFQRLILNKFYNGSLFHAYASVSTRFKLNAIFNTSDPYSTVFLNKSFAYWFHTPLTRERYNPFSIKNSHLLNDTSGYFIV